MYGIVVYTVAGFRYSKKQQILIEVTVSIPSLAHA